MKIDEESRVRLQFLSDSVVKFDDRNDFHALYATNGDGKAVDYLIETPDGIVFLEVKNFTGDEAINRWRITCGNERRPENCDKDSLDIEVLKKVRTTIATLVGAKTFERTSGREISPSLRSALDKFERYFSASDAPKIKIVLLLEGANYKARPFTTTAKTLRNRLKTYFKWLNCDVAVVDCATVGGDAVCRRIFAAAPVANG